MTGTATLYGITNSDTLRKARGWLREHGVGFSSKQYQEIFAKP